MTNGEHIGVDLSLPGNWWEVPIADSEVSKAAIHRYVSRTIGKDDRFASLRARLRDQFSQIAAKARSVSGQQLFLCVEIVPGVPVPASLTVYWPDVAISSKLSPLDRARLLRDFVGVLPDSSEDPDVLTALGDEGVLRRVMVGESVVDGETVPNLEVDFWVAVPRTDRVVVFSFSSSLVELKESLLHLFGSIVVTARWTGSAAEGEDLTPTEMSSR